MTTRPTALTTGCACTAPRRVQRGGRLLSRCTPAFLACPDHTMPAQPRSSFMSSRPDGDPWR